MSNQTADLRLHLHNAGTAEWVLRIRRMQPEDGLKEMMRISQLCVDALDTLERLDADATCERAEKESLQLEGDRLKRENQRMRQYLAGGWQPIETKPPGRVLLWFPQLGYPVTGDSEVYSYVTGGWKATHWMTAPLAPGSSQTQPNLAAPESGTGAASSIDVGDPYRPANTAAVAPSTDSTADPKVML